MNVEVSRGYIKLALKRIFYVLAQVFSEDGSFQISSQELIKHFKTSKWKVPKHELTDVKDFYDYIENPGSSCAAYALLGKEQHVQLIERQNVF